MNERLEMMNEMRNKQVILSALIYSRPALKFMAANSFVCLNKFYLRGHTLNDSSETTISNELISLPLQV